MKTLGLTLLLVLGATGCTQDPLQPAADLIRASTPTYSKDIKPLMVRYCEDCHTSEGLRAGGVELDRYVSLYWARAKNVCVSIQAPVVEEFAAEFPETFKPYPYDSTVTACGKKWDVYSMPPHADSKMTYLEQLTFAQWVATGAQP